MLIVDSVSTYYGKFEAIKEVSLSVDKGEMVFLIGANGAGKTTLLRTICGLNKPKRGTIFFEGDDVTLSETVDRVRKGIAYCPEGIKLFPEMTVLENLEMGAYVCDQGYEESLQRVFTLFPVLKERKSQYAGLLSGGEQQMLAVGRTLMSKPKLILFDEATTGLSPVVVMDMMNVIKSLNKEGITILLVEQDVYFAFEIGQRGYIMENGRIVLQGDASALRGNKKVKEAYLGG